MMFWFYSFVVGPALRALGGAGYGCRFHPSCSEYARESLLQYGWLRGGWKSIGRVIRCNPWSSNSWWDPVISMPASGQRLDSSGVKQK